MTTRKKLSMRAIAPCVLALALVLAPCLRADNIYPTSWSITSMAPYSQPPPASPVTFPKNSTISFFSRNEALFHRIASGQNDSMTVWAKNGYTLANDIIRAGELSDFVSYSGGGEYNWTFLELPSKDVTAPAYATAITTYFKTTYQTNNMTDPALVFVQGSGNAWIGQTINITN